MFAIGFTLFVIGVIFTIGLQPDIHFFDWRDLFTTLPLNVGMVLMMISLFKVLWEKMP